jgi:uncharacterized tellurite resistance protein B-like protein
MTTNSIDEASGLSSKMALCLAAITLVGIDGEFKEEELDKLRSLVRDDEMAFLKAFEFYNSRSLDTCIQVVVMKFTDKQKQAAYSILLHLAHADSTIAESEQKLLQQYAQKFGFTEKTVSEILQSPYSENELTIFD